MNSLDRPDDFEVRRKHLDKLSDDELHTRFWELANKIITPLVDQARTHTTPAIERSVLLRMGLASDEASQLVERMAGRKLLGHGAGHLLLQLSLAKGLTVRAAALALLDGDHWDELNGGAGS